MLKNYLDTIEDLAQIDVDKANNILEPTDKGAKIWPAIRHLRAQLYEYLKIISQHEKICVDEILNIMNIFYSNQIKAIGKIDVLFSSIHQWLDINEVQQKILHLEDVLKAVAFVLKTIPDCMKMVPYAASFLIPKDLNTKISVVNDALIAKHQRVMALKEKQSPEPCNEESEGLNFERKKVVKMLDEMLLNISEIKKKARKFIEENGNVMPVWTEILKILKPTTSLSLNFSKLDDSKILSNFWNRFHNESDFLFLVDSLFLDDKNKEKWLQFYKSKFPRKLDGFKFNKEHLSVRDIENALTNAYQYANQSVLDVNVLKIINASQIDIFLILHQDNAFYNIKRSILDLKKFFSKEIIISARDICQVQPAQRLGDDAIKAQSDTVYQIIVFKQNVSVMKSLLEEQLDILNGQQQIVYQFLDNVEEIKKISESLEGKCLTQTNQLTMIANNAFLFQLKNNLVLSLPDDSELVLSSDADCVKFYYINMISVYLKEVRYLTHLLEKIESIGEQNFSQIIDDIRDFVDKRKGCIEWFIRFLCPTYQNCCMKIEAILKIRDISSLDCLTRINQMIHEAMDELTWGGCFLKVRLKSITQVSGNHFFHLPKDSEVQQNIKKWSTVNLMTMS